MIDQTTEGGKALQAAVKTELKSYLGQDYNDDVLPLYIVVMLAHGNQQPLVKDNLEAFLGSEKAGLFAAWLFQHLKDNIEKYDPTEVVPDEAAPIADQPAEPVADERLDSGSKRPREKREKIEWKGSTQEEREHPDEKRRRSGGRAERSSRPDYDRRESDRDFPRRESDRDFPRRNSERGRFHDEDRDWDRRKGRDRYREHTERYKDRQRRRDRSIDSWEDEPIGRESGRREKHRRHERSPSLERPRRRSDRRESDEYLVSPSKEARVSAKSRLANRRAAQPAVLANSSSDSEESTPPASPRIAAKPSVFERLQKNPGPASTRREKPEKRAHGGLDMAIKTRMRMDALPSKAVESNGAHGGLSQTLEDDTPPEEEDQATQGGPQEVAAELRQIREQLAKMNAERAEKQHMEMATQLARKAYVQNVHFNATPEILKAHFGGCGNVVSAVIEKEATGRPRGVAILEFDTEEARRVALTLSGSSLLGRPITVLAKELQKTRPAAFVHPGPSFRPRAPMAMRGRGRGALPGRGSFAGRPTLKNNKYVRPPASVAPSSTSA